MPPRWEPGEGGPGPRLPLDDAEDGRRARPLPGYDTAPPGPLLLLLPSLNLRRRVLRSDAAAVRSQEPPMSCSNALAQGTTCGRRGASDGKA